MDGVHPKLICGAATTVRDAEGLIATPGGIDVHVHFDSAQLVRARDRSGLTTMIGGSLGPITVGIDCGGEWNVGKMLQASEHWPMNFGFLGRGNTSQAALARSTSCAGGCLGLKIHEDWGAMPAVIDTCLAVADELDFQVQLHTDTLNESGFLEDTLAAINGRTIHMYHTEGAGGGHAPDIIAVAGRDELPALVDQPDQPLHRQHVRRAPRHDHGVPPPESGGAGGRGLRRSRASARRPSPPRTCCTTWARSPCWAPTARAWGASTR